MSTFKTKYNSFGIIFEFVYPKVSVVDYAKIHDKKNNNHDS